VTVFGNDLTRLKQLEENQRKARAILAAIAKEKRAVVARINRARANPGKDDLDRLMDDYLKDQT
jgi:hypothetical protein